MMKIALVTGATSGIGRATAIALSQAGYTLALCGRREPALHETSQMLDASEAASLHVCDVADSEAVARMFQAIRDLHGRLDVLFNNAGGNVPSTNFGDLTLEQWRQVISVNLDGAFLVARGAYRLMRDQDPQGGRIINNGSISAHAPRPGSAPYTSSKHGITGLTRSIALDGRSFSIACGQIDIGNAASDMTERMARGVPQADGTTRPEPTMNVRHVADAVVNMASLPLDANVQFMTIMATQMPFIGRG